MALEQWEIDLRNQLNGVQGNVSLETPQELVVVKETVVEQTSDLALYFALGCFLLVASLLLLDFKTNFISNIVRKDNMVEIKVDDETLAGAASNINAAAPNLIFEEIESLKKKVKSHGDKIFLLGVVSNENSTISKYNGNKKEMIFINKDWTLSRKPTHLSFTQEDMMYLDGLQSKFKN
jgi:hypothetical protein